MKRIYTVLIKIVVLVAFLFLAQILSGWLDILKSKTFNFYPAMFAGIVIPILFGILLRADVFMERGLRFHPDWPSLLIIGLPSLFLSMGALLYFVILANIPLPGFMQTILAGGTASKLAGVAFGYTLINGLFRVEQKEGC